MYPVSDEFLEKIQDNHRKYYWTGCMTTTSGTEYQFTGEDILKNSGYISRQCSGSTELEIGSVYASELCLTLLLEIDRYTLEGAEIKMYFHLILEDDKEEIVPMGIFEVVEANRYIKTIEIKAYDYMLRFDKAIDTTELSGYYEYPLLPEICACVGVGLATSEAEFKNLPGGGFGFALYEPNDISTYRDLLFYLCQMLGCVAQINRLGALELKSFQMVGTYIVPNTQRFSSSYSDYITKYTSITYKNLSNGETYTQTSAIDDGLNVDLGSNPFLQSTEDAGGGFLAGYRLYDVLKSLSLVKYTPFESSTIGNPALDPMDCISNTGGHADDEAVSVISHIVYRIGGKQTLKCVGSNPKLGKSKSSIEKTLDSLVSGDIGGTGESGTSCQCIDQRIVYLHYVNANAYTVKDSTTAIISKDFTTLANTTVLFHGTVVLEVSGVDGTAEMTLLYKLNESTDVLSDVFQLTKTVTNGKDFLTLYFCTPEITQYTLNQFKVEMSISSGEVIVAAKNIRASLHGQYLQAEDGYWNGTLEITDTFSDISLDFIDFTVDSFEGLVAIEERHAGDKEEQYQFITIYEDIAIELLEMEVTGDV